MTYSILPSKVFSIWTQKTFACSKSTIRTKFEICSQLTIMTLERRHRHHCSVFILNLEQFSHLFLELQFIVSSRVSSPPAWRKKNLVPPTFPPLGPQDLDSPASSKIFLALLLSKLKNKFWTFGKPTFC